MRRQLMSMLVCAGAIAVLTMAAGAQQPVGEPTSEGHPHKWTVMDKGLADLVADGFELKTVVYDNAETAGSAVPDVHYFLQKAATLVRCDFRKRDQASIYWCFRLMPGKP
ncbi:MAG TPA: hypothetical protein VFA12_15845 [Stellaceae bacterium]|nr:hypothetical protein [Stellaceae bacterium]